MKIERDADDVCLCFLLERRLREHGRETEFDGEVVGVANLRVVYPGEAHQPLRYGEIAELAVAAHARRRGVGSALVAAAEAWARERGCAYTVLDYNARNVDAGRFYRDRLGYRPAGEIVLKKL